MGQTDKVLQWVATHSRIHGQHKLDLITLEKQREECHGYERNWRRGDYNPNTLYKFSKNQRTNRTILDRKTKSFRQQRNYIDFVSSSWVTSVSSLWSALETQIL